MPLAHWYELLIIKHVLPGLGFTEAHGGSMSTLPGNHVIWYRIILSHILPSFLFLQISLLSFSTGLFSPLCGQPPSPQSKRYAQDFPRNQQQERSYNLDCQYFKQSPLSIETFLSSSSLVALTHHPFLQYRAILA